jgi:hypothetical protein
MSFPKNMMVPKFNNSNNNPISAVESEELPDYTETVDAFVPFSKRIILKRDETTTNHPCADDLVVGELVLNAMTGNLYTKLVSGQIVYYPGLMVCVAEQGRISNTFSASISVPENYKEEIYTISLNGITLSTHKNNSISFNSILNITQGFPSSFALLYSDTADGIYTEIARITMVTDYTNANFEFVYKTDSVTRVLNGRFSTGIYDNKSLGFLKLETV